jgi:hypothetical protein
MLCGPVTKSAVKQILNKELAAFRTNIERYEGQATASNATFAKFTAVSLVNCRTGYVGMCER